MGANPQYKDGSRAHATALLRALSAKQGPFEPNRAPAQHGIPLGGHLLAVFQLGVGLLDQTDDLSQ